MRGILQAKPTVIIVMATYQGERFLPRQLASLIRQTWPQWQLLVRDDGSTDATPRMLARAAAEDKRIRLVQDGGGRLGVLASYNRLLKEALRRGAAHAACCDQDDVWEPHRLVQGLEAMARAETNFPHSPILVHSDLLVVDAQERALGRMKRFHFLRPNAGLASLLLCNPVTGSTILMNRALLEAAVPIPDEARLHDAWIGLCAEALGRRVYLDLPLVRYRQHTSNVVGARPWMAVLRWIQHQISGRSKMGLAGPLEQALRQAQALRCRCAAMVGENHEVCTRIDHFVACIQSPRRLDRLRWLMGHAACGMSPVRLMPWVLRLACHTPETGLADRKATEPSPSSGMRPRVNRELLPSSAFAAPT